MEQKRPDDYEVPTAKNEQRGYRMIYCVEDERNIRELLVYTLETTDGDSSPSFSFCVHIKMD